MYFLMSDRLPLLEQGEGFAQLIAFGWILALVPLVLTYGLLQAGMTNLLYGQAQLGAVRFRTNPEVVAGEAQDRHRFRFAFLSLCHRAVLKKHEVGCQGLPHPDHQGP